MSDVHTKKIMSLKEGFEQWEKRYKCDHKGTDDPSHGCYSCHNTGYTFDHDECDLILDQHNEIEKLQKENEGLKKTVEFYADKNNWGGYHRDVLEIFGDSEPAIASDGFKINLGGRRARQTLKELEDEQ